MFALLHFKHKNGILQKQIWKTNNKAKSKRPGGLHSAAANWWDFLGVRHFSSILDRWTAGWVAGGRDLRVRTAPSQAPP